jgi:predicted ATPase
MNKIERIILIGAHGTGKSTLADALSKKLDIPVVESVAREFFKNWKYLKDTGLVTGLTPNGESNVKQNILCSMSRWDFMRWVNADIPVIMTRCPLDTLAYAAADKTVSQSILDTNKNILLENEEFMNALNNSLFIYLPIEFNIENDGVRPTDIEFQKEVDEEMRKLIYEFKITPLVVSGSVDERVNTVVDYLKNGLTNVLNGIFESVIKDIFSDTK